MKTLILVRHAKSAWPDISLPDYERPLETQGIEDSNQMGKYLKTKLTKPDYIITSGAKRTLETAKIISKELVKQPIALNINKSIYGASINEMENIIKYEQKPRIRRKSKRTDQLYSDIEEILRKNKINGKKSNISFIIYHIIQYIF